MVRKYFISHIKIVLTVAVLNSVIMNVLLKDCFEADLGRTYVIQDTFEHSIDAPVDLLWKINDRRISKCTEGESCTDYYEDEFVTKINALGHGKFEFTLVIKKVRKEDVGILSMSYLGPAAMERKKPLFACHLSLSNKTSFYETTETTHNSRPTYESENKTYVFGNAESTYESTYENISPTTKTLSSGEVDSSLHEIIFGVVLVVISLILLAIGIYFVKYYLTERRKKMHIYESVLDLPKATSNSASIVYVNV